MATGSEKPTFEFKNKRKFLSCAASAVFMGIRLISRLWMGRQFTYFISVRKDHKLCTSGPYSIVRHPGYTGFLGNMICDAVYWNSYAFYAYTLWLMVGLWKKMDQEEEVLRAEFEEEFDEYVKKTPSRIIPFLL